MAVKFVFEITVKVNNVEAEIDWATVKVIVVPETEATKQFADTPVPDTVIPTII